MTPRVRFDLIQLRAAYYALRALRVASPVLVYVVAGVFLAFAYARRAVLWPISRGDR